VPPVDDTAGERFRSLILQLRGRTGLTQRELAARVGVNVSSIQGWEAGTNYPGVASLKALVAAGMQAGGFTSGREADEVRALWAAALRDAPRFRAPFDAAWFEHAVLGQRQPGRRAAGSPGAAPAASPARQRAGRRESWGEAPDVAHFVGRVNERALLRQWVLDEGSRLVAVLGLGGIGKSLLATQLAHDLAPSFERVFWRSLRDAPTPGEWLAGALGFLAPDDAREAGGEPAMLRRLLELIGEARCLLVLDNGETVLQAGGPVGAYRAGYERYGTLLRQVAEAAHRSCLLITSREEPLELGPLLGERGPVRALELGGFGTEDGRALLHDKQLDGDEGAWRALIERYGGNGLALKVVGETTRELFGGSIADYLAFASETSAVMAGGVRQLLESQVKRLSDLEVELLRRLAVEREPVGLVELAADLGPRFGRRAVLEAVEGLRRRSLLERTVRGPLFALHSVVLEYVTDQLVEDVAQELVLGEPDLLLRQPLLKATAKDYVRRSQERLIGGPILERLRERYGRDGEVERRLVGLLDTRRGRSVEEQGYGPGNVVNLLRLLRGDLRGADLSGLAIRQGYLQDVEAQAASLSGAHLAETVLGEAFNYPTSMPTLSADGSYLAVGTANGEICRWRLADRTLLVSMPGHTGQIWGVTQSGDGRLVASGGADGTIRLWDAEGGRPPVIMRGHTGGVRCVALGRDRRLVASGGTDGTVRLWDTESGRPLATMQGHQGDVFCAVLSEDGRMVVSGGLDSSIRLWDVASGQPLAVLHGHTGAVRGVALSGDGRLLVSASLDKTVRLWDVETGRLLRTLHGHTGGVRGVAMSRDGRLAASGGAIDMTVRLWDTETGATLAVIAGHTAFITGATLSDDGRLVASGAVDGTVRVWETETGLPLADFHGQTDRIWGVALSGDARLVASSSVGGTVRIWETETGQSLTAVHGHTGMVSAITLSADSRLVASSSFDGTVQLRAAADGRLVTTLVGPGELFLNVALSTDGRLVASSTFGGEVRIWEVASGRLLTSLRGHAGAARGLALSGDGRLVATGSADETVRVWDAGTGESLAALRGHTGEVYCVALAEDGRLVVSGGLDGTVRLWDVGAGQPPIILHRHTSEVYGVALSRDGRLVASAAFDGTVRLWETDGGRPRAVLQGHVGGVWGVSFDRDGLVLASGGDDGTVRLWDVTSGDLLRTLRLERRYEGLDISGLTGITDAQRGTLFALGAVERHARTAPSS
jgi:WD40 repeat protein/transcriptional regulator with XRE-family HTH domain